MIALVVVRGGNANSRGATAATVIIHPGDDKDTVVIVIANAAIRVPGKSTTDTAAKRQRREKRNDITMKKIKVQQTAVASTATAAIVTIVIAKNEN